VNPALPYDVERDFTPLCLLAVSPSLVLVSPPCPAQTLEEFIAWARARRGQVNYGSSGVGTGPHLAGALFDRWPTPAWSTCPTAAPGRSTRNSAAATCTP
jgi:tripartite-type tricarboxylate transporter receptor subunit TctC